MTCVPRISISTSKSQPGWPVAQLRRGLGAHVEIEVGVNAGRGSGSLPDRVLRAVLLQRSRKLAHAMRIVDADGNGRGLADGGQSSGYIERRLAAAGYGEQERRREKNCSNEGNSHESILTPAPACIIPCPGFA